MISAFVVTFVASLAATVIVAPAARRLSTHLSLLSRTEDMMRGGVRVPLFGGVALAVGMVAGMLSTDKGNLFVPLLVCSLLMGTLGLVRDLWPLRSATLVAGQLLVALMVVAVLPPVRLVDEPVVNMVMLVGWIAGLANAFTALERSTPAVLATGIAAALLSLIVGISAEPQTLHRALIAAAGAASGLLTYAVFLRPLAAGHVGTGFLGAWLGTAAIGLSLPRRPMMAIAVPVIVAILALRIHKGSVRDAARPANLHNTGAFTERSLEVWVDLILTAASYYGAFRMKFGDLQYSPSEYSHFFQYFTESFPLVLGCQLAALLAVGKYHRLRFVPGAEETLRIAKGVVLGVVSALVILLYQYRFEGFSRQVFAVHSAVITVLLIAYPTIMRAVGSRLKPRSPSREVLIYGAGRAGALLVRELVQNDTLHMVPLGFIDDDASKRMLTLDNIAVLGTVRDLPAILVRHAVSEVLVSMKELPPDRLAALSSVCREHGVAIRRLRWMLEDVEGSSSPLDSTSVAE